ncbi:MAG: hypothetical protein RL199_1365 [Pseudomonadota bacterium]|jgi:predicted N-acetyltransferase YhbS
MPASLRMATDADVPRLMRFIDEHWQKNHILSRDEALLRWQFRAAGASGGVTVLLGVEGDEIAGMMGLLPAPFCDDGRERSGISLANWVARPEWRHEGLGLKLLRATFEAGYDYVGGLGVGAKAEPLYRAMRVGWHADLPRWAAVVDEKQFRSLAAACGPTFPTAAVGNWVETRASSSGSRLRIVEPDAALWAEWDRVWSRRLAPGRIGVWKSAAYLRWRFLEHPTFRYVVRMALDDEGAPAGLAVHRVVEVRDRQERVLRLVDLLADDASGPDLASEALASAARAGVAFAEFQCSDERVGPWLEAAGFVRESTRVCHLPSLFQPLDHRVSRLNMWGKIAFPHAGASAAYFAKPGVYFTRADADQDRPS